MKLLNYLKQNRKKITFISSIIFIIYTLFNLFLSKLIYTILKMITSLNIGLMTLLQELSYVLFTIVFIIVCIGLVALVLLQEGKAAGLGAISGAAETYWGKNKGRSMEGTLVKVTKVLVVLFIVLAVILNMNF